MIEISVLALAAAFLAGAVCALIVVDALATLLEGLE